MGLPKQTHPATPHEVLSRLENVCFTLKNCKMCFFAESVEHLGFYENKIGLHLLESTIEAVTKVLAPTDVSMLHPINLCSRVISQPSTLLNPYCC